MTKITLNQVNNAFLPSREIANPDRFSGREESVTECYNALLSEGTNIAIVGNRGIGKSSLSRQIVNMSTGDNSLLDKLGIYHDETLDFLTLYYASGDSVQNTDELLNRLLTTRGGLLEWMQEVKASREEIEQFKKESKTGLYKYLANKINSNVSRETSNTSITSNENIQVTFQNIVMDLIRSKITKNGILIVIDEFNQIPDTSGFASFLKSLATNIPELKFCIVGVADNIQELMKKHLSSDRLFAWSVINLRKMNNEDLRQIVRNAEASINNTILLDEEATNQLITLANGHPYIMHLLGKQTYKSAYLESVRNVSREYIKKVLTDIAEREADPVLEGRYRNAVALSKQREIVLKALAASVQENGDIFTTDAYRVSEEQGVENASQYVGQLVKEEYGSELIKIRDRYYKFKDSLFHTYITARPSLF